MITDKKKMLNVILQLFHKLFKNFYLKYTKITLLIIYIFIYKEATTDLFGWLYKKYNFGQPTAISKEL